MVLYPHIASAFFAGRRITLFLAVLVLLCGCARQNLEDLNSGYPEDIAGILRQTCATSGCHDAVSAEGAAGLNLATWTDLFRGSRGGSPVVPYSPDMSYLLYSVNNDSTLGPTLSPTMPLNQPSITRQDYDRLRQWIRMGAPNARGEEPFPPTTERRKWYIGHQDCDDVAVFDAESRQIMRYIPVGTRPGISELVNDVKVAPNGEDWFVVFIGTNSFIERYSTLTDEKVAEIPIGHYFWNTMAFSPDSRFAFVASDYWRRLAVIDLEQNALVGNTIAFGQKVLGPAVHPTQRKLYLAQPIAEQLFVLDYDSAGNITAQRQMDLVQYIPSTNGEVLQPRHVEISPDGARIFVACAYSQELRVYDGSTEALLEVIPMPDAPGRLAYSPAYDRLFVSCPEDLASWGGAPKQRGSVVVVNTQSLQIETTIYAGYQSDAMLVDEASGVLVVLNRNTDTDGPAPHHASTCGDKNGYATLIDLQTLEVVEDYKPELLANPITVAGKF